MAARSVISLGSVLAATMLQAVVSQGDANPTVKLYTSRMRPDRTLMVRLLGRDVGAFTAFSADVHVSSARLRSLRCPQPGNGVRKGLFCSEPQPGTVRLGLVGFNDDPLVSGELARVVLTVPDDLPPGRYPISAVLRFARADGSEFELGPIGATVRIPAWRKR